MSDFIFTDEESQAQAAASSEAPVPAKKKRAPAKKKAAAAKAAPLRASSPAPVRARSASSSGSNSTAWLLIFICLLAVAAYFAYQYYNLKNIDSVALNGSEVATMATTTEETVPTTTDPAADWLTYTYPEATSSTSTISLFALKYPPTANLNKADKRLVFDLVGATSTSYIVSWEKSSLGLDAYLAKLDKASAKSWEGKPAVEVVTSTAAILSEKYPVVLRQQKMLAADLNQYVAYIKTTSTIYAIALTAPELNDSEVALFSVFLNNFIITE